MIFKSQTSAWLNLSFLVLFHISAIRSRTFGIFWILRKVIGFYLNLSVFIQKIWDRFNFIWDTGGWNYASRNYAAELELRCRIGIMLQLNFWKKVMLQSLDYAAIWDFRWKFRLNFSEITNFTRTYQNILTEIPECFIFFSKSIHFQN